MMTSRRSAAALAALSVSLSTFAVIRPLCAQTGRGSVTGQITDAAGRALQGAQVALDPGAITTLTDAQGQYTLTGIASGQYTLTVTYSGFSNARQQITVGITSTRADASLKIADTSTSVNVVAGREGGEIEAINRTFNADNIINVLPADVIISLPNANVADAIGRLPNVSLERDEGEGKYVQVRGTEPRLTNVTIDGVNIASAETVRQVKLDIIPADLVESVQINKTLEANMPGDGIGGSVDIRTKSAASTRPSITLESTGGYTPQIGGRAAYAFDGTLGKRFNAGKLGALFGGHYDWNGRGINDVEPGPVLLGGYDVRDYRYYRDRRGFAGTLDYRFNDTSSVYLKGLYALFHNDGDRWDYNIATGLTAAGQPDGSGSVTFGAEIRRPVQDLGSAQLGGRHVISRSLLAWDVESSVGRTRDNGYSDASFKPASGTPLAGSIQFSLDTSNPLTPKLVAPAGVNLYDPAQYYYTGQRKNFYYNPEVDLGFGASIATNYTLAGHASTFEVGGRFRNVHKFANQNVVYFTPVANANDPSLQMTRFLGAFTDPGYYGGTYQFGPTVSYDTVRSFAGQIQSSASQYNNFDFNEKVSAGYVMDTINLAKFRIVGGVRVEGTNDTDAGNVTANTANIATSGSYVNVLPSASVRYALNGNTGLRAVYSRGLSRPNFADLVSFATVSPGGVRTLSTIGNPNLKAEHADNFDLLFEKNLIPVGLLQAGGFYKRLTQPIISLTSVLPDKTIQSQPQNAGSAYVYGFEIAFQQHFTYLPNALRGTGLSANYGYTSSKVTFPVQTTLPDGSLNIDRTDRPRLLRQAPHAWNISPTYDLRKFSARLGLTYNAANIFAYNYNDTNASGPFNPVKGTGGGYRGPNGDQYLCAHLQVDIEGTYSLPKGFQAVAYGLNLNNEVFGFYQGSTVNPVQREFYRQTFGGGLRWSPSRER